MIVFMPAADLAAITAATVLLTQFLKWAFGDSARGRELIMVFILGALVEAIYVVSTQQYAVTLIWQYFIAWLGIVSAAMGVYGFVRSGPWVDPAPPQIVDLIPTKDLPEPPPVKRLNEVIARDTGVATG